ncbi:long-chain fatty acid--CoA ligase [Halorubellus sp. JP-L1]|uniref:AMP-binding protein n=1 Tax=Halorubellus sp. JP-L1 TaxID=2715753 RepID=UPI00140D26B6|nr:AMP-binding protein [Halorubellus sp. JP-L1]NHN43420.1 long-chain fatty acid--CoA ligase [Halorubellus sp. JP-L1]
MTVHGHGSRPYDWVGDWSARRRRLSPDAVGLRDATTGEAFTYRELDERANATARLLAAHGVSADSDAAESAPNADAVGEAAVGGRVAVVSRNRPALVDLFFATGKTGGVLAPLSHRLAERELAELLEDVAPSLVVVEGAFDDDVAAALAHDACDYDGPVLGLGDSRYDAFDEAVPDDTSAFDGPDLGMDDAHVFLHTGGSTGTPKETVLTHGSIAWNSFNTITAWGLRPEDVTPMVFPMFHTGGWNVLTVPLFHLGAEVVIAREFDAEQVLGIVDEDDATVLVAVPAVLRMMTAADGWAEADLSTLRFAKSGGGPCRQSVMEAWWDRGVDLSQGYGLTECGPNNFAMPEGWTREKADSVGVPAMHVDARVVDDDGRERDQGAVGELELASPHAGDRYWRAPEESRATFGARDGTDDADGEADDGGAEPAWVSTGDLARVDADGYVHIEGRKKEMFVSGGENVYPAEVEDVLSQHAKVDDVVVVPVPDDTWGEVGKAVVQGDESLTLADLEAFCDGKLARFKIPAHLAFVDEMPTSGPSKIDRGAIEERFGEGA